MSFVKSSEILQRVEPTSVSDSPSHRYGLITAVAIALQFAGYLLLWSVSHSLGGVGRGAVSSEMLVSAGWYDKQSAYLNWIYSLPILPRLLDSHLFHVVGLGAGLAIAITGYLLSLVLASRAMLRADLRRLLLMTAVIALPLLLVPQLLSSDVWSYAFYGRIPLLHGGNPFVDLPSAYPTDPLLSRLYWKTTASVYGPVWVGVSVTLSGIAQLLGGAAGAYLLTFKLFLFACHLGNVALIYRLLRRIRPGTETWGAIFYGWNPLVLIEFAWNAHNDVFMITLILIAVLFAVADRPYLATVLLTAAGLAKLTGLLGLPVYAIYIARRSPQPVVVVGRMIGASLAVIAILYVPFWHGMATFRGTAEAPNFKILHRSPAAAASTLLERVFAHGQVANQWRGEEPPAGSRIAVIRNAVRKVSMVAFVICFLVLTIWPVHSAIEWVDRLIWIYVAYIVFAALYFNPWYVTWVIPLAALIRRPWPILIAASLFFLLFYLPVQPRSSIAPLIYWPWPLLAAAVWHARNLRNDRVAPANALVL